MSQIKKILDEREMQNKQTNKQTKKTKAEKNKGDRSYSETARAKWFCCAFKLGFFLQLICNVSLILKLNLELALSIVLKKRELYESKYVVVECRCLKTMILVLLFDMFLNPSFKVMATFANIARTTAGTSKFIY